MGLVFGLSFGSLAEQIPVMGVEHRESRESPSLSSLGCVSQPVTRMPVMCCCSSHKDPFLSIPGGFSINERTLSYEQKSTSLIAVSLIKHDFFTNLCKHFDLLPRCSRLRRVF